MKKTVLTLRLLALALLTAGCTLNVTRTGPGEFQVESTMSQAQIQTAIQNSLQDPDVQSLTASLQDGYILVAGEHRRASGAGSDTLTFRLDLGVSDGHLTASISDVQIDNFSLSQATVDEWNAQLADGLTRAGQESEHSTLASVTVTSQAVTMVWIVAK